MKKSKKLSPTAAPSAAKDPSRMWSRPGFLLRRLHQIHYGLFFEECGFGTLTPLQFGLLTVLTEHPEGMDIGGLAMQLGTDRSTTADVARRLARKGYIVQGVDGTDRRKCLSGITKEGRQILKEMDAPMQKSQERLLLPLTPIQRERLMDALKVLVRTYNDKGRAKMQL
jgi:DNA-binding MarR family transcriptional regulator